MVTPLITEDLLEFMSDRFDVPARLKDDDHTLRWKAAQRATVLDLQALHNAQRELKSQRSIIPNNSPIDPRKKD